MLAGIREILIVTNLENIPIFQKLLGNGNAMGINIKYAAQEKPNGIAKALYEAKTFSEGSKLCVILGDNIFHGIGLGRQLAKNSNIAGAKIFAYKVSNPTEYGVVEVDESNMPIRLTEKPEKFLSDLAVTGLYFYDETVFDRIETLTPSTRGEYEITSLNNTYLVDKKLKLEILSQGTTWLDTGSPHGLNDASNYIRLIQERQNNKVGDPVSIAKVMNWI